MDAQIKKGILEMCILQMLNKEDYYGYTIMQEMRKLFPEVNESTFYAILRRLHKEDCAEVYWGNESNGPRRKYYHITENGRKSLESDLKDWKEIIRITRQLGIE